MPRPRRRRLRGPGERAAAALTGEIQQVPPGVSAIKVGASAPTSWPGRAPPELAARAVTVREFAIATYGRRGPADVDVAVRCSSGTYVRALARDLGESLGVGGHLTMLRRTRVGPYGLDDARGLDELAAASG